MGELIIPRGIGKPIRGICTPEVQQSVEGLGQMAIARASNVEPGSNLSQAALKWLWTSTTLMVTTPKSPTDRLWISPNFANKWFADCLPVGGPVLGPYDTNETAKDEEVKWLRANNIPVCEPCRTQIEPPTTPILTEGDLH